MKNKLQSVISFHKYHTVLISLLFSILIIAFALLVYHQDNRYVEYDKKVRQQHFREYKKLVDLKFSLVESELEHLRASCESELFESAQVKNFKMPFAYNMLSEDSKGFNLDNISKYKNIIRINVTGNGPLKERSKDFYRYLRMALLVNADFAAIKKNIPEIKFIYHYSVEEIYVQHPWEHSNIFRFDKKLYTYDNWKEALPGKNPDKKIFWTKVYFDHGGKGLMTTCVTPIYDNKKFVGIIAMDLTIDFLNTIITEFEPKKSGIMMITDNNENLIAHPEISSSDSKIKTFKEGLPKGLVKNIALINKSKSNVWNQVNNWWVIHSDLSFAPFKIYYFEPCESTVLALIRRMTIENFLLISIMVIIVYTSIILTQQKIIHPSLKFIKFILCKSKGEDIKPDNRLPKIWKPWFTTVDNVFTENHLLTENVKQNNIKLASKNSELKKEIEAKVKAEKEKESLEKQLIEEEKIKAIGLLAGGIAHDFNNQLAVIMGYASVLRSKSNISDAKRKQCLNQILTAAESSSGLIKQILAFAQKGKYENIPVDIHEIITWVASILSRTVDKRVSIKMDFQAKKHTIKGDPSQIQNVIMNIAINAKNAMPNGGMITFSSSNVTIDEKQCQESKFEYVPGDYIQVSITDTGTGIPEENIKRIFEPFFTTRNSGHGAGLGLAAAMGAIKNHKGGIYVESAKGVGAQFKVLLPVLNKNTVSSKPAKLKKINSSKIEGRILLVDDENSFCRMLTDFMGALGYSIASYNDPVKAIEYYQVNEKDIDLVIMDMIMPKINGNDLIGEFMKINPETKFIISSGYCTAEDIRAVQSKNKNIKAFYKKPFDLIKFANEIAEILDKE